LSERGIEAALLPSVHRKEVDTHAGHATGAREFRCGFLEQAGGRLIDKVVRIALAAQAQRSASTRMRPMRLRLRFNSPQRLVCCQL